MDNITHLRKKLLAAIRNADYEYGLIQDGDHILIGLSGGKDSVAMVDLLQTYQKFRDKNFTIAAMHLDFGFPPIDFSPVENYVKSLDIPYYQYDAKEVYEILEANRNPMTHLLPCSICSRMRKAIINKAANKLGFKKVAFAHHMDDAIETLFLNMTHGARIATFEPKMYLENAKIEFIRPLIYAREKQIATYASMAKLPICKNSCGNDKHTQREEIKELLNNYYKKYPDSYSNFAVMLKNYDSFQLFFDKYGLHPKNQLEIKKCFTGNDMLDVAKVAKADMQGEDFASHGYVYYLLRKEDVPVAYLKIQENADFSLKILSLHIVEGANSDDVAQLIDTMEKNYSMKHVPRKIDFVGTEHAEIFEACGYEKSEQALSKTIVKALKI